MYPTFLPISNQIVIYLCLPLVELILCMLRRWSSNTVLPRDGFLGDSNSNGVKCVFKCHTRYAR